MNEETAKSINQYLSFTLGTEYYAVDVSKVKEVLELSPVTRIPKMPPYMRGIINLRGSVVPVVDLRVKFDMPDIEPTVDTSIIVLEIRKNQELLTLGVLVDGVQEVVDLPPENIEPAPKIGTGLDTEFITGMGKYNDTFLVILNVNEVFTREELTSISYAQKEDNGATS